MKGIFIENSMQAGEEEGEWRDGRGMCAIKSLGLVSASAKVFFLETQHRKTMLLVKMCVGAPLPDGKLCVRVNKIHIKCYNVGFDH